MGITSHKKMQRISEITTKAMKILLDSKNLFWETVPRENAIIFQRVYEEEMKKLLEVLTPREANRLAVIYNKHFMKLHDEVGRSDEAKIRRA